MLVKVKWTPSWYTGTSTSFEITVDDLNLLVYLSSLVGFPNTVKPLRRHWQIISCCFHFLGIFNSIILVVQCGYRRKNQLRVINCVETSWRNTKWRGGTPHSNMRPVSTWRHQQMRIRQHRLAPCARARRSERRRQHSFGSAGNAYGAISSDVHEGWNRVAEWRIPQGVDPRSRGIGCTQVSNHLSVFDVRAKTDSAFRVAPRRTNPNNL